MSSCKVYTPADCIYCRYKLTINIILLANELYTKYIYNGEHSTALNRNNFPIE